MTFSKSTFPTQKNHNHPYVGISHSHLHLDGRMWVVVTDFKVLCTEIIDTLHFSQDLQLGEGSDFSLQLHV